MIHIVNYTKIIKGNTVLRNINLSFEAGKVYGLHGKNGSGKTMLMRAISGLILPTQGHITINGRKLGTQMSFPESIGVLIENPAFLDHLTGYANLELIASIKRIITKQDILNTLEEVGLDPNDKRTYRKYSLGMKQKLGIAAAIMESPMILILDEPLNALDSDGIERVRRILCKFKEKGTIIILACHDYDELEALSDEIIKLEDGKVVSD